MPPGTGNQRNTGLSTPLLERSRFAWQHGQTFQGADGSFRRSMNRTLGYKDFLTPIDYFLRYKRGGVAKRIIDAYPRAAWVAGVEIVETEDAQTDTTFEKAARDLFTRLDIWARMQRADILAGLGNYSVLLIGGDGELDQELKRFRGPDAVLYLRPIGQLRARIAEIETDKKSARYGLPLTYSLSAQVSTNLTYSGIPNQIADVGGRVHYSRVLHIAHGLLEDDVYGTPVLEAPWNYLDDLDKIIGGGAEATWKNMDPGRLINVDPDADWDATKSAALKDQIEEFDDGLVRWLRTQGVDVKALNGTVPMISASADAVIKLIAGTLGYPMRIFVGSERGHLASTQDRDNWNDQVSGYRREFAEPFIRSLVDRFIKYGALPEPADGYQVSWPEEEELSEKDKSTVALAMAQANQAQVVAEGKLISTGNEIRDVVYSMEPLPPEQQPAPKPASVLPQPPTTTPPEPQLKVAAARVSPIRRVVAEHAPKVVAAVLGAWLASAHRIDAQALDDALHQRSEAKAAATVVAALDLRPITAAIDDAYAAGGEVAMARLVPRSLAEPLRVADALNVAFSITDPRAVAYATAQGSRLITEITDSVSGAVAEGLAGGLTRAEVVKRIRETVGLRSDQIKALERYRATGATEFQVARYGKQLLTDRAELIARTETGRAANAGQREAWSQAIEKGLLPVTQQRSWIGNDDGHERPSHIFMNDQVVGVNESFIDEDGEPLEPGEDPNCRCDQDLYDAQA